MPDAVIKVTVVTDTSKAQSDLKSVGKEAKAAGGGFKSTFGALLASSAVQKAAGAIWNFGKQSVEAYSKAEDNAVKYTDAMGRLPDASDATTKSLMAQAKALSRVTVYSAGQTKQAQATLASFHLTGKQIQQITPLVQDYAAKTGKDLPTAAGDLGKALLGQGRALKSIGINFKNTGSTAGNFAELTKALGGQVGGLAEQMGGTAGGKMAIMNNQFTALKVTVGSYLMPVLSQLVTVGLQVVGWIQQNITWLTPLAGALIAVVAVWKAWNIAMAISNAIAAASGPQIIVVAIVALVAALVLAYNKVGWFRDFVNSAFAIIKTVVTAYIGIWIAQFKLLMAVFNTLAPIISAAFNTIKAIIAPFAKWFLLPFTLAFGLLRAAFTGGWSGIIAYLRGIPGQIAGALAPIAHVLAAPFIAGFNAIKGVAQDAWNWISGKINAIKNTVAEGIKFAKSVYNPFARAWNAVQVKIGDVKVAGHTVVPGFTFGLPDIPLLARGGYTDRAALAVLGEGRGGEFAAPEPLLRRLIREEAGTGQGVNLTVNIPATANPAETGREVAKVLRAYFNAGGRLAVPA